MTKPLITQSELMDVISYNPDTGEFRWIKPNKYHSELTGMLAGNLRAAMSNKFYRTIAINGRTYIASRLAFLYMKGRWPDEYMDHINGESTDDRWSNLREASPMENSQNRKRKLKKSPLPMGVRAREGGKYQARIQINKKPVSVGVFNTPEEASNAYIEKRMELFGEFA